MKDTMHSMATKRYGWSEEVAGLAAKLAGTKAGVVTRAMHTNDAAFAA